MKATRTVLMLTAVLGMALLMTGCASIKHQKRLIEYKELTKNICIDNPDEIYLAQTLFIKYVRQ